MGLKGGLKQTSTNRSQAPASQGDSGRHSIASGLIMAHSWPGFTDGAVAPAPCAHVERSNQWNTSLRLALSKDWKEDYPPFIQKTKKQLLGLWTLHSLNFNNLLHCLPGGSAYTNTSSRKWSPVSTHSPGVDSLKQLIVASPCLPSSC